MREGGVVTTDPTDGGLQVKEALLLQGKDEGKSSLVKYHRGSNIIQEDGVAKHISTLTGTESSEFTQSAREELSH